MITAAKFPISKLFMLLSFSFIGCALSILCQAENKAGHRPLNSYQLPKWVYHPERVNRRTAEIFGVDDVDVIFVCCQHRKITDGCQMLSESKVLMLVSRANL
jgi:hypothetical protein